MFLLCIPIAVLLHLRRDLKLWTQRYFRQKMQVDLTSVELFRCPLNKNCLVLSKKHLTNVYQVIDTAPSGSSRPSLMYLLAQNIFIKRIDKKGISFNMNIMASNLPFKHLLNIKDTDQRNVSICWDQHKLPAANSYKYKFSITSYCLTQQA